MLAATKSRKPVTASGSLPPNTVVFGTSSASLAHASSTPPPHSTTQYVGTFGQWPPSRNSPSFGQQAPTRTILSSQLGPQPKRQQTMFARTSGTIDQARPSSSVGSTLSSMSPMAPTRQQTIFQAPQSSFQPVLMQPPALLPSSAYTSPNFQLQDAFAFQNYSPPTKAPMTQMQYFSTQAPWASGLAIYATPHNVPFLSQPQYTGNTPTYAPQPGQNAMQSIYQRVNTPPARASAQTGRGRGRGRGA